MKKVFGLILAISLVLTVLFIPVQASEDPVGTVIISNSTTTTEVGTNPEFYSRQPISAKKTNGPVVESAMSGVSAIAMTNHDTNFCKWTPSSGKLASGAYEVWIYNIGQKDSSETWRAGTTVAARDLYAKYDVVSGNGKSTYYINQGTATGDANGWVKLGTFNFAGNGNEYVQITKTNNVNWASYTYVDKAKFVPVTSSGADLKRVYASANGTEIDTETTEVLSSSISKRIPNGSTTYSVKLEAADNNAFIYIDGIQTSTLSGSVTSGTLTNHEITVTSADGSQTKTYKLSIDMEGADAATITNTTATIQVAGRTSEFAIPSTFTTDNAGYYNVYVYASYNVSYVNAKKVNVTVSHNTIREDSVINYGQYVNQNKWVYAGKYYFSGNTSFAEKIILTKMTPQVSGEYLITEKVKLVSSAPDVAENPIRGFTVKAAGKDWGIPLSAFDSNGNYYFSAAAGTSIGFMVTNANTNYTSVKVNGVTAGANSFIWPSVVDGDNLLQIVVTQADKVKTYNLAFHKEVSTDITIAGYQATKSGTIGEAAMLINSDGNAATCLISEGAYFKYIPAFTAEGYCKVLAWRPSFTNEGGINYGSPVQKVEIYTGIGQAQTFTVDWASLPSKWVDLGTYKFASGSTPYVKFEKTGSYLLMDKMKFISVAAPATLVSVSLDGTNIPVESLDGYVYHAPSSSLNITPVSEGTIEINTEPVVSGDPINIPLQMGVNKINIKVSSPGSEDCIYNFNVITTNHIVLQNDATVTKTGTWGNSAYNGHSDLKAIYNMQSGSINFPLNTAGYVHAKGLTEVWVYRVEGPENAETNANVTINAAGKEYVTSFSNYTGSASGWVKLGEYVFSGSTDGTEKVVISHNSELILFADSIKLVNIDDVIVSAPVLAEVNSQVSASVTFYHANSNNKKVLVVIAKYDNNLKMTGVDMQSVEVSSIGIFEVPEVKITKDSGTFIKVFVWDGSNNITPLHQAVESR